MSDTETRDRPAEERSATERPPPESLTHAEAEARAEPAQAGADPATQRDPRAAERAALSQPVEGNRVIGTTSAMHQNSQTDIVMQGRVGADRARAQAREAAGLPATALPQVRGGAAAVGGGAGAMPPHMARQVLAARVQPAWDVAVANWLEREVRNSGLGEKIDELREMLPRLGETFHQVLSTMLDANQVAVTALEGDKRRYGDERRQADPATAASGIAGEDAPDLQPLSADERNRLEELRGVADGELSTEARAERDRLLAREHIPEQ